MNSIAVISNYFDKFGRFQPSVKINAEQLHYAIIERHGINASVGVNSKGLFLGVKTIQSVTTLMRMFNRFNPIVKATGGMDYTIFIQI